MKALRGASDRPFGVVQRILPLGAPLHWWSPTSAIARLTYGARVPCQLNEDAAASPSDATMSRHAKSDRLEFLERLITVPTSPNRLACRRSKGALLYRVQ